MLFRSVVEMTHAALGGNWKRAQELHLRLFPLCQSMFYETNPIPVKTAMKLLRLGNGELRLPMTPMGEGNVRKLEKALKAYGLPV